MRDEGTFGEVTVFCYTQGITDGTTQGQDFRFDPKVLCLYCCINLSDQLLLETAVFLKLSFF